MMMFVSNCGVPQTKILLMRLLCVTCLVVGVVLVVSVSVIIEVSMLPNWHHTLILPFRIWRVGIY